MKKVQCIALMAALAVASAGCAKKSNIRFATILSTIGNVSVENAGKKSAAQINMQIEQGAKIMTEEKSIADIAIGEHSLRIFENSTVELTTLLRNLEDGSENTAISLDRGAILTKISGKISRSDRFTTSTGTIVASVRGTMFLVTEKNVVACLKGTVSVRHKKDDDTKAVDITAGKMAKVEDNKPIVAKDIDKDVLKTIDNANSLAGKGEYSMKDKPEVPLPVEKKNAK